MSVVSSLSNAIKEGDLVYLYFEKKDISYLVEVKAGKTVPVHRGRPLLMDDWIGKEFGDTVECTHETAYLLKPSTEDLMMKVSRQSGIIYPKDAGVILMRAGIKPGDKIMEIGSGSGSLTTALATAVGDTGKVYTYDLREDFSKLAQKNITKAGLADRVSFNLREPGSSFEEVDFDVAIMDIPNPWDEIHNVKAALKGGATLISLTPTFNQIEKAAECLKSLGFVRVEAGEVLYRSILARYGKTRPAQRMCAHTEFIVSGVKTNRAFGSLEETSEESQTEVKAELSEGDSNAG